MGIITVTHVLLEIGHLRFKRTKEWTRMRQRCYLGLPGPGCMRPGSCHCLPLACPSSPSFLLSRVVRNPRDKGRPRAEARCRGRGSERHYTGEKQGTRPTGKTEGPDIGPEQVIPPMSAEALDLWVKKPLWMVQSQRTSHGDQLSPVYPGWTPDPQNHGK